jgi:hypothetical protein
MSLTIILPKSLNKVERQIKALKAVIPKDNLKDKVIHEMALRKLEAHKESLLGREADNMIIKKIK